MRITGEHGFAVEPEQVVAFTAGCIEQHIGTLQQVIEFLAPDAALARTAAGVFKQNLLHFGYPGRVSTAGNLAFAFTPSEIDAGTSYRFVLYHVMREATLEDIFQIRSRWIGTPPLH